MLILLADANSEVLAALRLVLEQKQEYKIVGEVNDTIGLFSQITHHCPDVIILDADLHGLKSSRRDSRNPMAELIQTLHMLCPTIYIIALSSLPNKEKDCIQAGANTFFCKSNPPDALFSILQTAYIKTNH
jgi:DNA-binding NarL/FixJ family response regulator